MKSVMFKLVSPLPNIIMLGDFNLPTMAWSQPGDCLIIISSTICQFTYKEKNILDLVFCNSELIDSIDICDTFISDHCLLTVTTFIPVCLGPWKTRVCRGPATITRLPSLFINKFFHNIKLLQPYDVCRHQPEPFYGPDCYICEH